MATNIKKRKSENTNLADEQPASKKIATLHTPIVHDGSALILNISLSAMPTINGSGDFEDDAVVREALNALYLRLCDNLDIYSCGAIKDISIRWRNTELSHGIEDHGDGHYTSAITAITKSFYDTKYVVKFTDVHFQRHLATIENMYPGVKFQMTVRTLLASAVQSIGGTSEK